MQRLSEILNVNTFIVSQVNPFVIPFLNDDGGGILGTQSALLRKVKNILGSELIHWVNQLSSLGLFPEKLTRVIGVMNQNYKGDVTISPQLRFNDYLNILRNPTPNFIKETCKKSESNTYTKISLIKAIYEIEREINDLYKSVQNMTEFDQESGSKGTNEYDFTLNISKEEIKQGESVDVVKKGIKKSKSLQKELNIYGNLRKKSIEQKEQNKLKKEHIMSKPTYKPYIHHNISQSNFYIIVKKGYTGPAKPKLVPTASEPTLMSVYSDYTDDKDEKIQKGIYLYLLSK
jgi:hypothetical protein